MPWVKYTNNGLIIYDLSSDPYNPTVWAQYDLRDHGVSCPSGYVHDIYVRNDTAYCNMANCGYYVFDVSQTTPSNLGSLGKRHLVWDIITVTTYLRMEVFL